MHETMTNVESCSICIDQLGQRIAHPSKYIYIDFTSQPSNFVHQISTGAPNRWNGWQDH